MAKLLSETQEAAELRRRRECVEARLGEPLCSDLRRKAHLLFPFRADFVHPKR